MTKLIDQLVARPAAQRIPLALVMTIVGLFLVGLVVGVTAASIEMGRPPKSAPVWLLAATALLIGPGLLWLSWRLVAPPVGASRFEKRYWKMWLTVFALGVPVGMLFALPVFTPHTNGVHDLFSGAPLDPVIAVVAALAAGAALTVALWLYHRSIDDHEEQAYLWGSHVAFHFLALAVPMWWVLERGGLVPALDTVGAVLLLLASFIVQAAVWAWFKFR